MLNFCWIEEAYEITNEDDFNMLNESIRGKIPDGMFKQVIISFNPWSSKHWLKKRFFDPPNDENKLAITTTYKINEFLGEEDLKEFEDMRLRNPRRYQVAGLGDWGVCEGLVYENWEIQEFDYKKIMLEKNVSPSFGLDFGFVNDKTAFICVLFCAEEKEIYVVSEIYEKGMTNVDIYNEILKKGLQNEIITADCSEPKSIEQLKHLGIRRIKASRKGADSVVNGVQFIQDYKIIIHPKCENFINEISLYAWAIDKFGIPINKPMDENNHLMDAMRYALEDKIVRKGMIWNL